MDSWIFMVRLDDEWQYRWFVNNDYGQPVAMSSGSFWSRDEAEADLEAFLQIVALEPNI